MSVAADIEAQPSVEQGRNTALDTARGMAMVMVVLGHALDGAQSAGHSNEGIRFLLLMIYSTHIPLFLLVAGILSHGLCHKPWTGFLTTLGQRIVWPYLLWSFALLTVQYLMSNHTNTAVTNYQPVSILWDAPGIMWFLYALCIGLILRKCLMQFSWQAVLAVGLVCLLVPYLTDEWPPKSRYVGIFLIGAALGPDILRRVMHPAAAVTAGFVMLVTVLLALWQSGAPIVGYPASDAHFLPAIFAGPLLLYGFSHMLFQANMQGWLSMIGRNTMVIFVTHIFVTAGTRIFMLNLGITDWPLIIVTATCAGVVLPLMAGALARRRGISTVLGWP